MAELFAQHTSSIFNFLREPRIFQQKIELFLVNSRFEQLVKLKILGFTDQTLTAFSQSTPTNIFTILGALKVNVMNGLVSVINRIFY